MKRMFPLRLKEEHFKQLRDRAKAEDLPQVVIVRKALKSYLKTRKTAS